MWPLIPFLRRMREATSLEGDHQQSGRNQPKNGEKVSVLERVVRTEMSVQKTQSLANKLYRRKEGKGLKVSRLSFDMWGKVSGAELRGGCAIPDVRGLGGSDP